MEESEEVRTAATPRRRQWSGAAITMLRLRAGMMERARANRGRGACADGVRGGAGQAGGAGGGRGDARRAPQPHRPPHPPRRQPALLRRENRRQRLSRVLRAQNAVYAHQSVPQWTSDIIEGSMKKLTGLQKPFKYIGAPLAPPTAAASRVFALPDSGRLG